MYAPLKKRYIRGNNSQFMNRILSKEITKRTRLKNKCLKSKSKETRKTTLCVLLCVSAKENEKRVLWKIKR